MKERSTKRSLLFNKKKKKKKKEKMKRRDSVWYEAFDKEDFLAARLGYVSDCSAMRMDKRGDEISRVERFERVQSTVTKRFLRVLFRRVSL